jgi:RHS repeat-associated protein
MNLNKIYIGTLLLLTLSSRAQNIPNPSNQGPSGTSATPATIADLPPLKINYLRETSPMLPVKTDIQLDAIKDDCTKAAMLTACTDGLGRPIQTIIRKPFNVAEKKDQVMHHSYDAFGREKRQLLPFAKTEVDPINNGKFTRKVWTNLRETYNALNLNVEQFLYSEIDYEESPLSRVKGSRSEGNNWIGKNKGTTISSALYSSTLTRWTIGYTAALPTISGTYSSNTLSVETATDEDGNVVTIYTDFDGKAIMKVDKTIQTVYVYDDLNRLRFEIPQKALTAVAANGNVLSQQIADELCTRYEYDDDGRLIVLKKPGVGETHYVYDRFDRIVLTQDANKRAQGKWIFTKYDPAGREIQSGQMNSAYTSGGLPANYTRAALQALADLTSGLSDPFLNYLLQTTVSRHSQYVSTFTNATVFIWYYFDSYDFTSETFVVGTNYGAHDAVQSKNVTGLLTGTKALLSDNINSSETFNFYNSRGELIQVKKTLPDYSTSTTTMHYDFKGRMIASEHVHGSNKTVKKYQYDTWDRIMFVHHRINSSASFTKIAEYRYDDLGRVSSKVLGNMSHPVNYEYNIRGWVTGINKAYCVDKSLGYFFGEEIFYDKGYTTTYLDGKIAGIQWRSKGTSDELRSYGYEYTYGRMTGAEYRQKNQGTTTPYDWNKTVKDFTTTVSYDPNGNIESMTHMGVNRTKQIITLDDLVYNYLPNSNRLKNIVENAPDAEAKDPDEHNGYGDFRDNLTISMNTPDYSYDANGNIASDKNRNADIITNDWFVLNKPTLVEYENGNQIHYLYDALGNLLSKRTVQYRPTAPALEIIYDYVDDMVNKDGNLQMIVHDEGRARKESSGFAYDYFLKDHIENVRAIITEDAGSTSGIMDPGTEPGYQINPDPEGTPMEPGGSIPSKEPVTYIATMEPVNNAYEIAIFENIEATRDLRPLSSDPLNRYCAKIIGTGSTQGMGPSIMLKVSADDKIQMGVESFYFADAVPGAVLPLQDLAAGLIGLITGGATISPEGWAVTQQGLPVSVGGAASALTQARAGQQDTTKPQAYLNYLFFDEKMQFMPQASGAVQVTISDQWKNIDIPAFTVPANGYLYAFTSNQTNVTARMDNMYVVTWTGRLLEETHYYPYGLAFDSYKAHSGKNNNLKYNTQYLEQHEFEDENGDMFGLDWYDFMGRTYDPQTGRWMQPDPMMQHASPYLAMGDNPVSFTDPLGLFDGINRSLPTFYVLSNKYKGWGTQEGQLTYAFNTLRGESSPQTGWEKRNWQKYNDPQNGSSHRGFNPAAYNNSHTIKRSLGEYKSYGWSADQNKSAVKMMAHGLTFALPAGAILKGLSGVLKIGNIVAKGRSVLFGYRATKSGTTVLGHYPDYVRVADNLGARRFQVPTKFWDKMSATEQWTANSKFLERMILRGDNIRLATPLTKVRPGSFFEKELNFLFERGFKVSSDGLWIIK